MTVWKGIGLEIFLWAIIQVVFLPYIGWGLFGAAISPLIVVATLVLHLVRRSARLGDGQKIEGA